MPHGPLFLFHSQPRLSLCFADLPSAAAKKHVQTATERLTDLRRVVLNSPGPYTIQYAHMLPRAAPPGLVNCNMRWGSLHVDTRYYSHDIHIKSIIY